MHRLSDIVKKYPNDQDLGLYIRSNYDKIYNLDESKIKVSLNLFPNDFDLGFHMRNNYNGGFHGNY